MKTNNKLRPIAEGIVKILMEKTRNEVDFVFEYKPEWLTCIPQKTILNNHWSVVENIFLDLTNNNLAEKLKLVNSIGQQSFDIWFNEPFNFAVEFDEGQHFNQFRLSTLKHYYHKFAGFNLEQYKLLNQKIVKSGTSGFCKLRSTDPLFPEFLDGIKQDNRIRQRAFRDFLKDVVPVSLGYGKTLRIPYHIINKKRKDFTSNDIKVITKYISDNKLL